MSNSDTNLPTSRHFALRRLADGVFAAIATEGAGAMSNAGIVDLGDRTLVFDTLYTPSAADDLRSAAASLTGRAPSIVVNSHFHGDHVQGNQVFGGTEIVAMPRTQELIAERTAQLVAQLRAEPATGAAYLRSMQEQMDAEPDEARRGQLGLALATLRECDAALPHLRITLPTLTFDDRVVFHGPRRRAELVTYGGGHTASDAFLYLPDDGILFAGDLVVVRTHPWLGHGDVVAWPQILARMERLDASAVVPGHGPVGDMSDLPSVRQYIAYLLRLAAALVREGRDADATAGVPVPEQYAGLDAPEVFPRNMRFLHELVTRHEREGREAGA